MITELTHTNADTSEIHFESTGTGVILSIFDEQVELQWDDIEGLGHALCVLYENKKYFEE